MTDSLVKDIIDLQDIDKAQFILKLRADPAKYAAYVKEKQDNIVSETLDTKRASFFKVSTDMARMMDMDHNSFASLRRTNELIETEDMIITEQERAKNSRIYNNDLTRRQVEINNWYYENKRETLYILQFVLLIVLSIVVILYLAHTGWIGQEASDYLIGIILIVGAGTWIYRWYYTAYIRDPRYWNQRKFLAEKKSADDKCPDAAPAPPPIIPTCPAGSRYDSLTGTCVKLVRSTVAPECPSGTTYNPATRTCIENITV